MPTPKTFCVVPDETERLDRFLADQLAISRTQAARLVANGAVTVNGAAARAGRRLTRGDEVTLVFEEGQEPRSLVPYPIDLDVVFEDEWLMVIDKPAGLVVHPAPGHWSDTLLNALVARGTPLSQGAQGRPGIVHRLDRDTSGLMVVAKTDDAHRRLGRALTGRLVRRQYAALVWGHVDGDVEVDQPIARHPTDRRRMAAIATGRAARTHVHQVARFDTCDLVRATLETGRTHQIRVHLAHIGHPVVSDPVYGGGGAKRVTGSQRPRAVAVERAIPRQALHAATLAFDHPATGEPVSFHADWPADLRPGLAEVSQNKELLARPSVLDYLGFLH